MKELLCLYCFKTFNPGDIHFRCNNESDDCPMEEDRPLAKYQGLSRSHKRAFSPAKDAKDAAAAAPNGAKKLSRVGAFFSSNSNNLLRSAFCTCGVETRKQLCPHCHNALPVGFGESENRIIALLGSKESGKSNYIGVLINELKSKLASQFDAAFSPVDDQTIERYDEDFWKKIYLDKVAISLTQSAKTDHRVRTPLIFRLDVEKGRLTGSDLVTTYVVFFDTAGEDLISGENMEQVTKYIARSHGIIFLLDPLQIALLQGKLREKNRNIGLPKNITDPQQIIIRAANLIRAEHGMPLNKKIKTPIAFTFSKIDALFPILESPTPLTWDSKHDGFFDLDDFEQIDRSMRMYINNWMGAGFNMYVKLHFENHAYFGLSALGSAPGPNNSIDRGVVPLRITDPFLWLLYKLNLIKGLKRSQAPLRF